MTQRARALAPGDVVRVAALVSVAVAPFMLGGVGVALFLLVLGGVMVPRALGVPAVLDLGYCVALLVAAWAAQLGWYSAVPWLDLVMHALCTGMIAVVAYIALVRWGVVPGAGAVRPDSARSVVVVITGLGAVASILWELGEWAGHTYLDGEISVGYGDTIGDLASALVGAAVAGVVLAAARADRPGA
jgi:hypothetical protein